MNFNPKNKIGEGQYGNVYKVPVNRLRHWGIHWDAARPEKYVAVKVIRHAGPEDMEEVRLTKKAAACVPHAIPEIYDSFFKDGSLYIVMELLDGYRHPTRLTVQQYDRVKKIVDTLRACGLVHGDIHFGNILVRGESMKLIDFGSAQESNRANTTLGLLSYTGYTNAFDDRNLGAISAWINRNANIGPHALHNALKHSWRNGIRHVMTRHAPPIAYKFKVLANKLADTSKDTELVQLLKWYGLVNSPSPSPVRKKIRIQSRKAGK